MTLFLLGPSKWVQGYAPPPLPAWLQEALPESLPSSTIPSPLDIRKAFASLLATSGHRAVVMEAYPGTPGEANAEKFKRLVREQDVTQFVLYWPFGANRSGLDVETGFLLERLRRKEILGKQVRVLVEDDRTHRRAGEVEQLDQRGFTFVSYEVGRRNRYYEDWLPFQAIITSWTDYNELREILENIAGD